MRALPNHYSADSSYTWFPLMTPDAMEGVLTKLGDIDLYNLSRPVPAQPPADVSDYRDAAQVLGSPEKFGAVCAGRASSVIHGNGSVRLPLRNSARADVSA